MHLFGRRRQWIATTGQQHATGTLRVRWGSLPLVVHPPYRSGRPNQRVSCPTGPVTAGRGRRSMREPAVTGETQVTLVWFAPRGRSRVILDGGAPRTVPPCAPSGGRLMRLCRVDAKRRGAQISQ